MRFLSIAGLTILACLFTGCEHGRPGDPWSSKSGSVHVDITAGDGTVQAGETLALAAAVSGYSGFQKGAWRVEETHRNSRNDCAFDLRNPQQASLAECPFGYILFDPHSSSKAATFQAGKFPGTFHVTYTLEMIGTGRFDRSKSVSGTTPLAVIEPVATFE